MDNQMQTCFKCKRTLPLSDFYVHSKMANGHLGKCKDCTRADTKKRTDALRSSPEWVEKEGRRYREKDKKRRITHPEKCIAKNAAKSIPCANGFDRHHWSYNAEHNKDVICIPESMHHLVHRYMVYDQERMMYRRLDGTLIDSREAAIAYYATLKD